MNKSRNRIPEEFQKVLKNIKFRFVKKITRIFIIYYKAINMSGTPRVLSKRRRTTPNQEEPVTKKPRLMPETPKATLLTLPNEILRVIFLFTNVYNVFSEAAYLSGFTLLDLYSVMLTCHQFCEIVRLIISQNMEALKARMLTMKPDFFIQPRDKITRPFSVNLNRMFFVNTLVANVEPLKYLTPINQGYCIYSTFINTELTLLANYYVNIANYKSDMRKLGELRIYLVGRALSKSPFWKDFVKTIDLALIKGEDGLLDRLNVFQNPFNNIKDGHNIIDQYEKTWLRPANWFVDFRAHISMLNTAFISLPRESNIREYGSEVSRAVSKLSYVNKLLNKEWGKANLPNRITQTTFCSADYPWIKFYESGWLSKKKK